MIRAVVGTTLFSLKSIGFLFISLSAVGLIRLFWSRNYQYDLPIKDAALLKKGDIILTGRQNIRDFWYLQLANVLTGKLKDRFWTHAAMYQGDGRVWEAQPAGVLERNLNDYLEGGYYLRAFRHKYIQDPRVFDQLIAWCASERGDGYDWRGVIFYAASILIPVGFNFIFDSPSIAKCFHVQDNYFCSELVVDAFEVVGYPISPFNGWRVKPADFISNPVLNEVAG